MVAPLYDYVTVKDIDRGVFVVNDNEKDAVLSSKNKAPLSWYQSVVLVGKTMGKDNIPRYFFSATDSAGHAVLIDEDNQVILAGNHRHISEFDKENNILKVTTDLSEESSAYVLYNLNTHQLSQKKYNSINLTKLKGVYKVGVVHKNPYREKAFFINLEGVEFYKE